MSDTMFTILDLGIHFEDEYGEDLDNLIGFTSSTYKLKMDDAQAYKLFLAINEFVKKYYENERKME